MRWFPFVLVLAIATIAQRAIATSRRTNDIPTLFYVSKSENKNEVHYGVRLDQDCKFDGASPVYAYWQMREGAPRVEALLPREESAYGIRSQVVSGWTVRLILRAMPNHVIVVQVLPQDPDHPRLGCLATPAMVIDKQTARLDHVFIQLAWPFGVSYLQLVGKNEGGRMIEERISK